MILLSHRPDKREAEKIRKEYRLTHPYCMRPIKVNGIWRFCRRRPVQVNEIAHGSNRIIEPANLCTFCDFPVGRCHLGWFHRDDKPPEKDSQIMLQMFGVKMLMEEATYADVERLMDGRPWWEPEMGDITIKNAVDIWIDEMRTLTETELPRLKLTKQRIELE